MEDHRAKYFMAGGVVLVWNSLLWSLKHPDGVWSVINEVKEAIVLLTDVMCLSVAGITWLVVADCYSSVMKVWSFSMKSFATHAVFVYVHVLPVTTAMLARGKVVFWSERLSNAMVPWSVGVSMAFGKNWPSQSQSVASNSLYPLCCRLWLLVSL